ncbi:MAG: DinB family protein [Acidobacteriaceae bacterium]|nr:DinB family protein [Acidobacteriaceae bacterium]
MTAYEARTHIRYSGWASRKVLEAALSLSPEEREKPMNVSHDCIAKTLAHIYFGDAILYSRIADASYPVPSHDALPSLDFVIDEWPRLQARWEAWADAATDDEIARQVPFKSRFVGNAGLPAWQIVMHVVNHATLHRGQIVGMLRQFGMKPPATDIVFFYYEHLATPAI